MRKILLCLLLCAGFVGFAPCAHAFKRAYRPVGDYVRASPLVVVADISTREAPRFETVFTVREILKNEGAPVSPGQTLAFPIGRTMWIVPREASAAVVVMAPDWDAPASRQRPVSEVYQVPEPIAAARALVEIYRAPAERAQLVALQKRLGTNKFLDEQWLADLNRMRERENFDLALSSYEILDAEKRPKLLQWLGGTGDARAVPLLLSALDSPEKSERGVAASALQYHFPDAPGVEAAFEKLLANPANRALALRYMSARSPELVEKTAAESPAATPPRSASQRAQKLLKAGQISGARAAYFEAVQTDEATWPLLWDAEKLLPLLESPADKTRLRALLVARSQNEKFDYLHQRTFAILLRALPDAANVPIWLELLDAPKIAGVLLDEETVRTATFALIELGAGARQRGAARVLAATKKYLASGRGIASNEMIFFACQLAWLADDSTWRDLPAQMPVSAAEYFASLNALRAAANSADEARGLAALVGGFERSEQGNARGWIIARLRELRAPIAVAPLLKALQAQPNDRYSTEIKTALTEIGGAPVEAGAEALLRDESAEVRVAALELLHSLRGAALRPLLRQIVSEGAPADRIKAVELLGYAGTADDLPLLLRLADFWENPRDLQSRAAQAVAAIRSRIESGQAT